MARTYDLDEHTLVITTGDFELRLPLWEVFEELTSEQLDSVAEVITADRILDEAVKRLLGTSESLVSNSDNHDRLTLEVLARMEHRLLSGSRWHWVNDLIRHARQEASKSHIYWEIYHDPCVDGRALLARLGIDCPNEAALPKFEAFESMVKAEFDKAFGLLPDIDITLALAREAARLRYVHRLLRDIVDRAYKVDNDDPRSGSRFADWVRDEVVQCMADVEPTTADDIIAQVAVKGINSGSERLDFRMRTWDHLLLSHIPGANHTNERAVKTLLSSNYALAGKRVHTTQGFFAISNSALVL